MVDNASADGAADMVRREFPQVRLIRNSGNAGFARANNQAARVAQGTFSVLSEQRHGGAGPNPASSWVDYLETHSEAVMVGPGLRDGHGKVQISYRLRPTIATFLHRTLLLRWTGLFRRHYQAYRRDVSADARAPGWWTY